MTLHQLLRKRLLEKAGIFEEIKRPLKDINLIMKEQWNSKFEQLMKNRMTMAYFRYTPIKLQIGKSMYDNVGSIEKRLELYKKTHNREHLVDIANLCLVEFTIHSDYPFVSIDDGEHTKQIKER